MKSYIYLFIFIILFCSCAEIVEVSLEDENVHLLAPANNITQYTYRQTFWWDKVDGATRYNIQIVKPRFDSVSFLICDSTITNNKITLSLFPGSYQWRVRAENNSSKSRYSNYSFEIDTVSLNNEQVILLSPQNNYFTNSNSVTLSWTELFGSNYYTIQIDTLGIFNDSNLLINRIVTTTSYSFVFPYDKKFYWRVRADNEKQSSLWSEVFAVTSDKLNPSIPVLQNPQNNQLVTSPVNLSWVSITDAQSYKVYVYKQDSTTLYNSDFPLYISSNSYLFSTSAVNQKFYWRIQSIDKAGNESELSSLRSFIVK